MVIAAEMMRRFLNRDGRSNERDVDIVFRILDEQIVRNEGGAGTYKTQFE